MNTLASRIQNGVDKGLGRWIVAANRAAKARLSGSGSAVAGSYPVPVRTGHLRRTQDYVMPRRSKRGITAKSGEAWLVNPANYAAIIHENRPFVVDAVEDTQAEGVNMIVQAIGDAMPQRMPFH